MSHEAPSFVIDISLTHICKYLRLLGLDVLCAPEISGLRLAHMAQKENRILVCGIGRIIPFLWKLQLQGEAVCVADLSNGKVWRSLNNEQRNLRPRAGQNQQQEQQQEQQLQEEEQHQHVEDQEQRESASHSPPPTAAPVPAPAAVVADSRKFHLNPACPTDTRRRRLVGYDSDGESEYEYEDEQQHQHHHHQHQKENSEHSVASSTTISASASTSSSSSSPPLLRYITIDIHAKKSEFKETVSRIVEVCGIEWRVDKIFSRCVKCGAVIQPVADKQSVKDDVVAGILEIYNNFYRCPTPSCSKVYYGVDNGGVIENYKAARTVSNLRSLFRQVTPKQNRARKAKNNDDDDEDDEEENAEENKKTGKQGGLAPPLSAAAAAAASASAAAPSPKLCKFQWGFMQRHLLATFPRSVKVAILNFLDPQSLANISQALPLIKSLAKLVLLGVDTTFVPERLKSGRANPRYSEWMAKQQAAIREKTCQQNNNISNKQ